MTRNSTHFIGDLSVSHPWLLVSRVALVGCVLLLVILATKPVQAQDEPLTIRLPEKYVQFTLAGAGGYIAFQFESENKAVVYQTSSGKVAFEIEQVAAGDLLAGSAGKLIVVSPSKMMLRRYDLKTGKRDKLALLTGSNTPRQAVMGCAGDGPLLLVGDSATQLIDLQSLKPLEHEGLKIGGRGSHGLSVLASAEGRTFGTIPIGYGPVGYAAFHLEGERLSRVAFGSTSNAIRWAQPSADGHLLLQPGGSVVNRNGRPIAAEWLDGAALLPTVDPSYILEVRVDQKNEAGQRAARITLCSTADCRPLLSETGFPEIVPKRINSWHDIVNVLRMGNQWRVQLIPASHTLLTLPAGNTEMVIRRFEIGAKLKASELDYLYVTSLPPLSAVAGQTLDYPVEVQTAAKRYKVTLADGPEGARLRKDRLQWKVPDDYPDQWARFLLTISNSAGEEIFHSFEVAVNRSTAE